jgi:hypothetical protein
MHEDIDKGSSYLVAPLVDLEIRAVMVQEIKFKKVVYAWEHVTLNYAI